MTTQNPISSGDPRRSPSSTPLLTGGLAALLLTLGACTAEVSTSSSTSSSAPAPATQPSSGTYEGSQPADSRSGTNLIAGTEEELVSGALGEQDGHEGHDHGPAPAPVSANAAPKVVGKDAPRLDVEPRDHDFGRAVMGEKLTHTFKLAAAGGSDLVITSAKPTCGCTVAKLLVSAPGSTEKQPYKFGDPIKPGTEMELTAVLDTKNKTNVASSKINIFCNDPRTTIALGLNAVVDTYFQIAPSAIGFGEISVADTVQKSVRVSSKHGQPFKLNLDSTTTPDGLTVELIPEEPDLDGKAIHWKVQVTLGPDSREGNMGYPINLSSDEQVKGAEKGKDGEIPTYGASVMVTARVRGLISYEPQYLSFGLVRPGQIVSRSMEISSFDPEFVFAEPKISIVGPNDNKPNFPYTENFSHVVRPSEDGKTVTVELTLNGLPDSADGSFQGRLIVETGHPSKPQVAVLFSGVCRAGVKGK